MAESATTARPYARAVFAAAQESRDFDEWSAFLAAAGAVVADARVAALIGNPRVNAPELIDFILDVAGRRKPAGREHAFLQALAENRRLRLLPEIAVQYEALRAEAEQQADVEVSAAQELTGEQRQRLAGALERRLGRTVRLHVRIDAQLLGGAVVRYQDFVIDGSLRGRIERMATAMSGA
jgi:F-type H+-transporting ATPase subunit delta